MTEWMNCNACKTVVINNETGICLGCQRGFTYKLQEDAYLFTVANDYYPEIEELKEKIHAAEKRLQQEDCEGKHQDGDEGREATKAGGSDRPINCS